MTAKAVYAHICAPHYAASAMDGVAVSAKETFGATETTPVTLKPDQFLVLDTGDPIPEDKDAVIMVEDIVKNGDGSITIHAAAAPWQHIRQIGEDVCAGEMILPSHMTVSPAANGAMIAGGVLEIEVIRKPVVGIIPTGDEVLDFTTHPDPGKGQVVESNSQMLAALARELGCVVERAAPVPDNPEALHQALKDSLDAVSYTHLTLPTICSV